MYGLPGMMSAHFHSFDYVPEVATASVPETVTPAPAETPKDANWDDIPF